MKERTIEELLSDLKYWKGLLEHVIEENIKLLHHGSMKKYIIQKNRLRRNRMKAILVIDIDANELPKDAYANIYVFGKHEENGDGFIAYKEDIPFKQIPKRQQFQEPFNDDYTVSWACRLGFTDGWNACLEEIEK